jgi:hypothetical protein
MSQIITVELCEDCILTEAGYDLEIEPDATPMSKLPDTLISPVYTDDSESEVERTDLAWHCDGCDTRLGGTRYTYHAVPR